MGSDGITRGAEILANQKGDRSKLLSLRRPIQHQVPLELPRASEEQPEEQPVAEEPAEQRQCRRAVTITGDLIKKLKLIRNLKKNPF